MKWTLRFGLWAFRPLVCPSVIKSHPFSFQFPTVSLYIRLSITPLFLSRPSVSPSTFLSHLFLSRQSMNLLHVLFHHGPPHISLFVCYSITPLFFSIRLTLYHNDFPFPSISLSIYCSIPLLFLSHPSVCPSIIPSRPFSFPTCQSVRLPFHIAPFPFQSVSLSEYISSSPYSFLTRQSVRLSFHYAPFPFPSVSLSECHFIEPLLFSDSSVSSSVSTPVFLSCLSSLRLSLYHARFLPCPSVCPSVIPSRPYSFSIRSSASLSHPFFFPIRPSVWLLFYHASISFPSIKLSVCHSITPFFPFPIPQSVHMPFHHAFFLSDSSVCHSITPFSFPIRPSVGYSFTHLFLSHPSVYHSITPFSFPSIRLPFYHTRILSNPYVCQSVILLHPFSFPSRQSLRLRFHYAPLPLPSVKSVRLPFHHAPLLFQWICLSVCHSITFNDWEEVFAKWAIFSFFQWFWNFQWAISYHST